MILYPEVKRKAQEELDRIVGRERPPTIDDLGSLPYNEALVKEVLRCKPPVPTGMYLPLHIPNRKRLLIWLIGMTHCVTEVINMLVFCLTLLWQYFTLPHPQALESSGFHGFHRILWTSIDSENATSKKFKVHF